MNSGFKLRTASPAYSNEPWCIHMNHRRITLRGVFPVGLAGNYSNSSIRRVDELWMVKSSSQNYFCQNWASQFASTFCLLHHLNLAMKIYQILQISYPILSCCGLRCHRENDITRTSGGSPHPTNCFLPRKWPRYISHLAYIFVNGYCLNTSEMTYESSSLACVPWQHHDPSKA